MLQAPHSRELEVLHAALSQKEVVFCSEVLAGTSLQNSAIKAGISKSHSASWASHAQKRARVAAYLEAAKRATAVKTQNDSEKILEELRRLAFFNIAEVTTVDDDGELKQDFSNAGPDQLAAVQSLSSKRRTMYSAKGEYLGTEKQTSVKLVDKLRAIELLGRAAGLFKEEKQTVVIDVADRLLSARARLGNYDSET